MITQQEAGSFRTMPELACACANDGHQSGGKVIGGDDKGLYAPKHFSRAQTLPTSLLKWIGEVTVCDTWAMPGSFTCNWHLLDFWFCVGSCGCTRFHCAFYSLTICGFMMFPCDMHFIRQFSVLETTIYRLCLISSCFFHHHLPDGILAPGEAVLWIEAHEVSLEFLIFYPPLYTFVSDSISFSWSSS